MEGMPLGLLCWGRIFAVTLQDDESQCEWQSTSITRHMGREERTDSGVLSIKPPNPRISVNPMSYLLSLLT